MFKVGDKVLYKTKNYCSCGCELKANFIYNVIEASTYDIKIDNHPVYNKFNSSEFELAIPSINELKLKTALGLNNVEEKS